MVDPPGPTLGRGGCITEQACFWMQWERYFRNTVKFNVFLHLVMLQLKDVAVYYKGNAKTKNGFRFEFELFLWHTRTPSVGYMTSTLRKPHEKAIMHDFDIKRAQCAYARRFKDFAQNMHQYTSKQELWY